MLTRFSRFLEAAGGSGARRTECPVQSTGRGPLVRLRTTYLARREPEKQPKGRSSLFLSVHLRSQIQLQAYA